MIATAWVFGILLWINVGFICWAWQNGRETKTSGSWDGVAFFAIIVWPFYMMCYGAESLENHVRKSHKEEVRRMDEKERVYKEFLDRRD